MNYLKSGNPFLSLPFLGFSNHPVHSAYLKSVYEESLFKSFSLLEFFKMNFWILWSCLPLVLLLIPRFYQKLVVLNKSLIIIALMPLIIYIRAIGSSSAGYGNQFKVLMPGIFILSALFIAIVDIKPIKFFLLALISVKSILDFAVGPGARYLLQSPMKTISSIVNQEEYGKGNNNYFDFQEKNIKKINEILDSQNMNNSLLVTDDAVFASQISKLGKKVTTIWSPELSILFEDNTTLEQLRSFLQTKKILFISNIYWKDYGLEVERLKLIDSLLKEHTLKNCLTCD